MVLVTWDRETGEVLAVRQGDGPGEYTDDVDAKAVHKHLSDVEVVDEEKIAGVIMSVYDGELSKLSCYVNVSTFSTNSKHPLERDSTITAIAFVELINNLKLGVLVCEDCDFSPSTPREWKFDTRETNGWLYHDWLCPECGTTAHTELVNVPGDKPAF